MTEDAFEKVPEKSFRPTFFLCMTLIMAFFIFSGFGMTYFQPMATGSLGSLPPVVHIHGLFYSSWIILLVVQALLVNVKNIALHRSLGTFGIAIGTGVALMGALITVLFVGATEITTKDDYGLTYLSVVAVLTFSILFCIAIRNVRKPEIHKRLILFATIVILPPGINRLYMMTFELSNVPFLATYMTMNLLIAAIAIYDWRTMRKISKTTLLGAAAIIIPEILFTPAIGSESFDSLCTFINNLAQYR
jgi:hypothetical protein